MEGRWWRLTLFGAAHCPIRPSNIGTWAAIGLVVPAQGRLNHRTIILACSEGGPNGAVGLVDLHACFEFDTAPHCLFRRPLAGILSSSVYQGPLIGCPLAW